MSEESGPENEKSLKESGPETEKTEKRVESNGANESVGVARNEMTVDAEVPGPGVARAIDTEQNDVVIPTITVTSVKELLVVGKNPIEGDPKIDSMVESEEGYNVVDSGEKMLIDQHLGGSVLELDDYSFKAPQKRKSMERHASKSMKKADVREVSQTDTDSESEASECSFTGNLPGSGFSSQVYNVDDIRYFLKVTKSTRRVKI